MMMVASFLFYVIENIDFNFGTLVVPLDGPNDFDSICHPIFLAFECSTKGAISQVADDLVPLISDPLANVVVNMACILIIPRVTRPESIWLAID